MPSHCPARDVLCWGGGKAVQPLFPKIYFQQTSFRFLKGKQEPVGDLQVLSQAVGDEGQRRGWLLSAWG